jgi:hypothetical protein
MSKCERGQCRCEHTFNITYDQLPLEWLLYCPVRSVAVNAFLLAWQPYWALRYSLIVEPQAAQQYGVCRDDGSRLGCEKPETRQAEDLIPLSPWLNFE